MKPLTIGAAIGALAGLAILLPRGAAAAGQVEPMNAQTKAQLETIAKKYASAIPLDRVMDAWPLAMLGHADVPIVPAALLMAVWHQESKFNPAAINPADPSYGIGQIQEFWVDGRIGLSGDKTSLMDPAFNARATAHVIAYFMGATQLADVRQGSSSRGKKIPCYRSFAFPNEVDVYNVGESKFRNGVRNLGYRNAVQQFFNDWSTVR